MMGWLLMKTLTLVLILFLTGCSSVAPGNLRSWEEFIPGDSITPDQASEAAPSYAKRGVSNDKTFPEDCDWQPLARVVDGDTLVLESDVRVRFIGIDTPETKHPDKGVEPFGLEASQMTKDLLVNSDKVCLMESAVGDRYDKYGRRLAYVFSEFGVDVNAELLRLGLAKGLFYFPFDRKEAFKAIEEKAKRERRNIWE